MVPSLPRTSSSNYPQPEQHVGLYEEYYAKVTGEFAFHLDILDEPVNKVITILLGGQVAMASFTLPMVHIGMSAEWSALVWRLPQIHVHLGLQAGIILDIGKVAILSKGVVSG